MISESEQKKIIDDMCSMIQCRTVSNVNYDLVDWKEFEKFRNLLKERFPEIYKICEFSQIGKSGIVHKIPATKNVENSDPSKKHGVVLMAHYDVVPANEENWSFPPFAGDVVDGSIRGRGTLDTKGTLCACMESVEIKLKKGWRPKTDLYLCFSGEEETNGPSCPEIVDWFKENEIIIDFVLDEGGAVVEKVFPGVTKRCALIGTAEKGLANVDIVIHGKPGHASAPPKNTSSGIAGKVAAEIEKHGCKGEFTTSTINLFTAMGKNNSKPALKFLFGNLWLTKPLVHLASKIAGGELNALLHTTYAITRLEGSKAYNVLPAQAKIGLNLRLLGSDTIDKAKKRLEKYTKKVCKKSTKFEINVINASNPSLESDINCNQYKNLCEAIHKTWPDVIISPYLMMACSDSRHYCRITDKIYRFSGMYLSKEERAMIHGDDEKISCETMIKTVEFYLNVLENL
ncbi:MAG: M20/M25/M40 family metallo-hydrolase [Treponemataceae bacterium]